MTTRKETFLYFPQLQVKKDQRIHSDSCSCNSDTIVGECSPCFPKCAGKLFKLTIFRYSLPNSAQLLFHQVWENPTHYRMRWRSCKRAWPPATCELGLRTTLSEAPPSLLPRRSPLPAVPTVGAVFKVTSLRRPCGVETIWTVHMTEPHRGLCVTFKILAGRSGQLRITWPPKTSWEVSFPTHWTWRLSIWTHLPLPSVSSSPLSMGLVSDFTQEDPGRNEMPLNYPSHRSKMPSGGTELQSQQPEAPVNGSPRQAHKGSAMS